jgi:hypothetical protein
MARLYNTVAKILKVFLETVDIRAERNHPIGVKGLFDVFLFDARVTHVREAEVDTFVFHIIKVFY